MQQKNFYIILGWGEKETDQPYQEFIKDITLKGYKPVVLTYESKDGLLFSENIKSVESRIIFPTDESILCGFSWGALIAYVLASRFKFKKVIIGSMSAVLENDLSIYPKDEVEKIFTEQQINEFNSLKYPRPLIPVIFLYGENETREIINRINNLSLLYGYEITTISACGHEFSQNYRKKVIEITLS